MNPYQVVISEPVLLKMLQLFHSARPKESYALLCGTIPFRFVYEVSNVYIPRDQVTSKDKFIFSNDAKLAAVQWSGKQGCELLGVAHSHIYPQLNNYGTTQSVDDAILQQENHLTLSAIIAFFGDHATVEFWLNGFSAPLVGKLRVNGNGKVVNLPRAIKVDNV